MHREIRNTDFATHIENTDRKHKAFERTLIGASNRMNGKNIHSDPLIIRKNLYNGEFDPGSG